MLATDPAGLNYRLEGAAYHTEGRATTAPIELPTGSYTVTVMREGYPEVRRTVGIRRGETSTESVALAGGSIALDSTPSGAEVWQDGRQMGRTPYSVHDTVPGSYAFELRLRGFQSATRRMTVTAKQTAQETVVLTGEPIRLADIGITMQPIPAGTFTMGSPADEPGRLPNEGPQTRVTITRPFWLGKTEVTHGQWKAIMGTDLREQVRKTLADDALYNINGKQTTLRDSWGMQKGDDPAKRLGNTGGDLPMHYVSWNEAVEFCRKLTERERAAGRLPEGYEYALPTEAQWEYACRAGTSEAMYAGPMKLLGQNNAPALDGIAWYSGNSSVGYQGGGWDTKDWKEKQYPGGDAGPRDVATKQANAWGLHDMLGNVFEWCRDWYGNYPGGSVTDPTGPSSGSRHVNRGGSWRDPARSCRSANRARFEPGSRNYDLGFRLALVPAL